MSTLIYTSTPWIFELYMYTSAFSSFCFRICADVIPGVVTKCLNARPKTKEAGILLCLMFVEIEQYAIVQVCVCVCVYMHYSLLSLLIRRR